MEYLKKLLEKSGWVSIVESLVFAILGIVLVWKPSGLVTAISYVTGSIFIAVGVIKILNYVQSNKKSDLFNYELFKKFKIGSLFVNTARGGVMVEEDLARALREGVIGAAAIDVLTCEPMDQENPLCDAPNITITPHVAWAPIETRERLLEIVCDNIVSFMEGSPVNVVN